MAHLVQNRLGAEAHVDRQPPRFWQSHSWTKSSTGEFVTGARAMRRKKINGCLIMIGDPARQFESQVELVVHRGYGTLEELRSFTDVVNVIFKIPPAFGHCFIFLYLNFKGVLRASDGRAQRPHCSH